MIEIKIFDVDLGFCALVVTDDRRTALIDCGYSFRTKFSPAKYILKNRYSCLDYLILTTHTEGHLAGFSDLLTYFLENCFSIDFLISNPSIDVNSFPELKVRNPEIGETLKLMTDVGEVCGEVAQTVDLGGFDISFFWSNYPEFLDIHNLSLVAFLSYQDIHIIFPGDLKVEGWRALLKQPEFCDRLRQVNLFVASNHGREEGYCQEVFEYCKPDLAIVSNAAHCPVPPKVKCQYENQAQGFYIGDVEQRLLTTGEHGTITISQHPGKQLQITTQKTNTPARRSTLKI